MIRKFAVRSVAMLGLCVLLCAASASAQGAGDLYKVTLVQAAPGKLLELIDLLKAKNAADDKIGEPRALLLRHSQGDHWDLMLLSPIGSYREYYAADAIARRAAAERANGWTAKLNALIAWQEDLFASGPPAEEVRKAFASGGFFHIEMFQALAGKHEELRRQREMENAYSKALDRPQNFIFVRDLGAAWDCFTIGVYRDVKHYAESADIPADKQEAAAKAAGFASASDIGPYLRTLIRSHHDTLAGPVR